MGQGNGYSPVPASPRAAPRTGLIASARTNLGGSPQLPSVDPVTGRAIRWEGGVAVQNPLGCDLGVSVDPCDPAVDQPDGGATPSGTAEQQWDPIRVEVEVSCNPGDTSRDLDQLAREKLEYLTSYRLERELWRGDVLGGAGSMEGSFLADATSFVDVGGGSAVGLAYALAALQGGHADVNGDDSEGHPGRIAIHATRETVSLWAASGQVSRQPGSAVLEDVFGNLVIPGVGYDGSDDTGTVTATQPWAFATQIPEVRLSDAQLVSALAETLDREENTHAVTAHRYALATFDLCGHVGVQVDICNTACAE